MLVVRILIFLCVTTGMAMAVLWHTRHTVIVGYEITKLEKKKALLEERNRLLEDQIGTLKSPGNILKSVDEMKLELLPPGEGGGSLTSLAVEQKGRKGR